MINVNHGLFNGLVEWGQDGKPHPELAESLEPKNGAKDWIFNLRKGVKFSNGKEFTADDAIYSLNLHRGDTKSGAAGPMKASRTSRSSTNTRSRSRSPRRRRPALQPSRTTTC